MSNLADKQYLNLCQDILYTGKWKENRTGVKTLGLFGAQMKFDMAHGFPLLTTKRVAYRSIIHELLWFISGSTNIKYLVDNDVNIWNDDAYRKYKQEGGDLEKDNWLNCIKQDTESCSDTFRSAYGELGYGTYGSMWREFPDANDENPQTIDQLVKIIRTLKTNPDDRRMIVTSWHPGLVDSVALPPCHVMFQFHTEWNDDKTRRVLNLQMYQRSCDMFLGVPFNIASYALLLHMVAQVVDMVPGTFIHTLGDYHIYENHIEQVKIQLEREPCALPKLWLDSDVKDLFSFKFGDIAVIDYNPHPALKGELSTGKI